MVKYRFFTPEKSISLLSDLENFVLLQGKRFQSESNDVDFEN